MDAVIDEVAAKKVRSSAGSRQHHLMNSILGRKEAVEKG